MDEQRGDMPDPGNAMDLAEFIGLLGELRAWAGMPSYRSLAKRVGPLMRPARVVSPFTVVDAFKVGRRRLDLDLVVAIVRALGVGEADTGRWRDACIKVHGLAKSGGPVGVFGQLPTDLATFTGRQEELGRLIEAATHQRGGTNTVIISAIEGMAGVGKTQLAIHAAHELVRAGHYADVQLHVNLRGFDADLPPADPSAVLEAFLRQLGVPAQRIPASRDERAAMYRDRLRERSAMVLLDNAADEDQVRDLIPSSPTCLVLITSRRSLAGLDGVSPHLIDTFSEAESVDLLVRIAGRARVEAEPEAAVRIVEYCNRLPLALALVAARLRSRPAWSLAELADRLQVGRLEAIRAGGRAIRPVFDLSYRSLPEPLRAMFRSLGLHPCAHFTAASAAALQGVGVVQAEAMLETLVDENLLQQRSAGRYALHDLLRLFAAELSSDDGPEARRLSRRRLADWYLHTTYRAALAIRTVELPEIEPSGAAVSPLEFESYEQALTWLDEEGANLGSVIRWAAADGLPEYVWRIALHQKGHFLLRWRLEEYVQSHALALAAGNELGDRYAQARAHHGMGVAYSQLKHLDDAEPHLRSAVELLHSIGERRLEAGALADIGLIHEARRDYHAAVAVYDEALAVIEDVDGSRRHRGVIHLNAGWFRHLVGDCIGALEHYTKAMVDLRAAGEARGEAILLGNIAILHRSTGDHERALRHFEEQHGVSLRIGDEYFQAQSLMGRAVSLDALGRPAEASDLRNTSLALAEKVGVCEEALLAHVNGSP
ncbi:tetratricopeptide repeat protein [Streptomyces puniciscabiei]|uniref:tetratricopeptide repeat protein n=1 Tax=Streptomyces puniciscabiei TaxID=164348 RepID=UPI0033249805